ncbi:hypothetical protein TNCV_3414451 [Trichonephila clavipes]|uniref:Uncharacterized protein n=1 Tax=Trichonephila clavipes TaxID=2585209 RepID=A0A8X6V4D6_TRICX|nr:hypothetical protein TNCV_3414451 [Trichonephila clavipes]
MSRILEQKRIQEVRKRTSQNFCVTLSFREMERKQTALVRLKVFTCRDCGGGDRGRVVIYRPFGELRRAKIVLSPVWCSRPTTGVPLAHATMNFVGLDLTASDRWYQKTTTTVGLQR